MARALFISSDDKDKSPNSSIFRIGLPALYLKRANHQIDLQNVPYIEHAHHGEIEAIDWTDIPEVVLVERTMSRSRLKMLRLAGARRVVLTFDDNYALIPEDAVAYDYWRGHLVEWLEVLSLVDLVIVPSRQLKRDFEKRCREIQVVPNYHDPELWTAERPTYDHKVLGWGGSAEHELSWERSGIVPALAKVMPRHPDWKLHLHGYTGMGALLEAGVSFELHPWANIATWAQSVRGFDVGLAPLYGPYDARRSNLKVLEYGLAGVPFVASDSAPYRDDGSPGGRLVLNRYDWERQLEALMSDGVERAKLGTCGQAWAQTYTMDKGVAVYEKLLWG